MELLLPLRIINQTWTINLNSFRQLKHLQAAISEKIDDKIKDLQNYFDQDMANFINQTKAVSDRL